MGERERKKKIERERLREKKRDCLRRRETEPSEETRDPRER